MLQHRSRAPVPGATLPRLLARLEALESVQPTQAPADLLGDWLDWQRAVALSRALDDVPQAPEPEAAEHAGMTPKAFHFSDGHPGNTDFSQRFTHIIELEGFNNRINLFHASP